MEEEEILGVNLDELSSLFTSPKFLGGRSFGWGLAPYKNAVINDDGAMVKDDSVVLYIDPLGEANLSSKLWMFQKADPLDAYVEPEFSRDNLFIKGLSRAIPGVPVFSVITYPTFKVEGSDAEDREASSANLQVKFPEDTPEGFVPCNGWVWEIGGVKYATPYLISRSATTGAGVNATTTTSYLAPPGCAFMMKLPTGNVDRVTSRTLFGREVEVDDITKPLGTWGSPG
jgi:hypothetical protein